MISLIISYLKKSQIYNWSTKSLLGEKGGGANNNSIIHHLFGFISLLTIKLHTDSQWIKYKSWYNLPGSYKQALKNIAILASRFFNLVVLGWGFGVGFYNVAHWCIHALLIFVSF